MSGLTIALVDDDADLRAALTQYLRLNDVTVTAFADAETALAGIGADYPGIVVSDVRMPGLSGIALFQALRDRDPELPVMLMTGHGDVPMAVAALKAGAWDFLTKPFAPDTLLAAARRAGVARGLALENRRLRARVEASAEDGLIGDAPAIRRLRTLIPMLGDAALDLVIAGETGTGKALYARLVHRAGARRRHRFVTIDCATIPPALVERDAFARGGIIAQSHRGTLLLDNLDRASPALQDRLTRLAEARAVALDSDDPEPIDLRIIATMAAGGQAHVPPTLFHRIAGMPLAMPPLAERREDIALLFAHFAGEAARRHGVRMPPLADPAHAAALRDWPGNVRELAMSAERFCLGLDEIVTGERSGRGTLPERMDVFERTAISEAIRDAGGEIGSAIEMLGVPRKTFYYRVKRLGIDLRALRARTGGGFEP